MKHGPKSPRHKANPLKEKLEKLKRRDLKKEHVVELKAYREAVHHSYQSKVLVCDPDSKWCEAVKRALHDTDLEVITCQDVIEMSEVFSQSKIDLILLAQEWQWVQGTELCYILKDHHGTSKIPIVLIADKQNEAEGVANKLRAWDDLLIRPIDASSLEQTVFQLLQKFD